MSSVLHQKSGTSYDTSRQKTLPIASLTTKNVRAFSLKRYETEKLKQLPKNKLILGSCLHGILDDGIKANFGRLQSFG